MTEMLEFDFTEAETAPRAGHPDRFSSRWHFVGAGLSNVWRYGDLDLPAPTGRLLLRGPNGTGKTTALEALWPYLLDLDAAKLNAGKARTTTLKQLMSDGAEKSGRRYGYAWLTFSPLAGADEPEYVTYGVRLQYSPNSSPAVKVVPFTVPARPVQDFDLKAGSGAALEHDDFVELIIDFGGDVFTSGEEYVEHLALRIWSTTAQQVKELAQRLRQIRNPALLGELSPAQAAEALRESLPGVASEDITATADALAESETTREAFERDRRAATVLSDFARIWTGHVVDVANTHLAGAQHAASEMTRLRKALDRAMTDAATMERVAHASKEEAESLATQAGEQANIIAAIEKSEAYKVAGTAAELERRLHAERQNADTKATALADAAESAAKQTQAAAVALDGATDRLTDVLERATTAGATAPAVEALLERHSRPRSARTAADVTANPGSGLTVTHDDAGLGALATGWVEQGRTWKAEAGTASSLIKAHDQVAKAHDARVKADQALDASDAEYVREQRTLATATGAARGAAASLLDEIRLWIEKHDALGAVDLDDPKAGVVWDSDDVEALTGAEPAAVLAQAQNWRAHALSTAERLAAGHESDAKAHLGRAGDLDAEARQLRARAELLRGGELLPFPRPEWAGAGDDAAAFGSVLEWRPGVAEAARDRIEVALADSGLLTAHLDADTGTAWTAVWRVDADGREVDSSLAQALSVDPDHRSAAAARAVLDRIRLADTAIAGGTGLTIGRDGTFAAGVLVGDPAGAVLSQDGAVPAAGFVGARTRRERALAEAARLEERAAELDAASAAARADAQDATSRAWAVRADGRSYPAWEALHTAESARAGAAKRTHEAKVRRDSDQVNADEAATRHQQLHDDWSNQARVLGMPADVAQLDDIVTDRRERSETLDRCVRDLRTFTAQLPRALSLLVDEDELATRLAGLEYSARRAHETAEETAALLAEVNADTDAADAMLRHRLASEEHERLTKRLGPAREKEVDDRTKAATAAAKVEPARAMWQATRPLQAQTHGLLATLLNWPPAFAALDAAQYLASVGRDPQDGLGDGADLLEVAADLLEGKATSARRTVNERYDEVRAELAQTWTLAHGDAPEGLTVETYVLTHAEEEYDPPRAARKAAQLAAAAESALAEAEAIALQDLVIGRLPTAIGLAWQRMHDWKNEVNAKMRSAQASSGVGVQVRVTLQDDLDSAARTVYHLSCEVGAAIRSDEQKRQVGDAITALLAASDGDTMADRLAAAIDIRSWVDVAYLVTRPGEAEVGDESDSDKPKSRKWGSRVGLSGGERRLVVLAPMLAAIAAGYDRLGAAGLRLVPLDEVPAEVDERGREGLARYIAELDLDLICTSYLWDGAPGAWDGIDGHDLEAGSSGTVVAFPTLVRGLEPIPGDVPAVRSGLT